MLVIAGTSYVFAEPLDDVQTHVLDFSQGIATIQIVWSEDSTAHQYEIGCVSCIPNTSQNIVANSITLTGITPLPNSTTVMLYIIAYDKNMDIIAVQQIIVDVTS